jgi:hypothetical protein
VKAAGEYYGQEPKLHRSVSKLAGNLEWLIQNGLLLPTVTPKKFLINPCLTFSKVYVKAEYYKNWAVMYQRVTNHGGAKYPSELETIIIDFINHVDKNFKRRGKRL